MQSPDANTLATLARRVNVVTDDQLREALDDLGPAESDGNIFLRILERKGFISSWQSAKLAKLEPDGYILGGYRILYRIAAGSFGRVFRAVDPITGTVVAVKVLRRRCMEDPHKVELFEREGKIGLTLQHPNIVRILAVSKDAATGQHFIVMEFVEGGNLKDFLQIRKKLAAKEAVKILEQCAAGLAYAVTRGLCHRDLKPTNILISSQGQVKLVDFGLAEIAGGADDDASDVDRTVDYAGLERHTNVKSGDPRSDIYFLGCVFYEMLTGRPPFPLTRDKHARMSKARFINVQPVHPNETDAPPSVIALLDRMMALEPLDRYQTASQMHDAIRRAQVELEGGKADLSEPAGPRTVFVVEANEKLRDTIREKFKEYGYRVLLAHDPARAVQRYKESPYHALIVDAGTAGEDGLVAMRSIVRLAEESGMKLAAVLVLNAEQADWQTDLPRGPRVAGLVRPITLKQLHLKLDELSGPVSS